MNGPPRLLDRFFVTGRVAIVSGSGRGIGAACARTLAEAGADVVLVARTKADLDAVAAQVAQLGRRSLTIVGDLQDTVNAAHVVERSLSEFGRLDILVNNVGGSPLNQAPKPQRAFLDLDPGYLDAAFHLNVTTALALAQQAVPHLLASGDGAIVNISSEMAKNPDRGMLPGGTAKAALSYMTKLMSRDLAPRSVSTRSPRDRPGRRRLSAITPPRSSRRRSPALPCAAWARPRISRWLCCSSPRRLPVT